MKILVTGAVGFIGSHTCERLIDLGHEVIGIDNFSDYYSVELKKQNESALNAKGISIINKDLRDHDLIASLPKDINYIFHFAAQSGLATNSKFEDYLGNNILATKQLIDYALSLNNLELFVNIGTSSIYGLEATVSEISAPKPASYYGVTKLAAEQLVLQKSRENYFRSCSLRLYSVYGPRERPEKLFAKLIASGIKSTDFSLYEGSTFHIRSFTYVKDIIDGIVSVIGKEPKIDGMVINLGTEEEYTTQEGIETVETILGCTIKVNTIAARIGDQIRTKANIDKARTVLNYNPKTSLLEGVKHQIAWYNTRFFDEKSVLKNIKPQDEILS